MRIITWNCRIGGFGRRKAAYMARLRPDILAVQEVEPIEGRLLFAGECQPTFCDRLSGAQHRRASALFSYTGLTVKPVDAESPEFAFRRYEVTSERLVFNVVVVWTYARKGKGVSYRQAHEGLAQHAHWMEKRPTVVLGDFNNNASFNGTSWSKLAPLLESRGLVSAYHHYFDEAFGTESRPTHFHGGKPARPFHLDYCFVPAVWKDRIARVEVGRHDGWGQVSDHMPVIVDLDGL
jgi:exonuclease III